MSYANPDILLLSNPIGIDAVVQSIQQTLYTGLPWLAKSFGRAWEFKESDEDGKVIRIPKAYMGLGEYQNVLPNDHIVAQSFVAVRGPETWDEYTSYANGNLERDISVIFWFNLKAINPAKDYIFTEELKVDVERILKTVPYVKTIVEYVDERAEDVFDAYDLRTVRYGVNDLQTQYLMYPYGGFRFTVTVAYPQYAACLPMVFSASSYSQPSFDVEITAAGGETSFQDNRFIGRKVRVTRNGIQQYQTGVGSYWSFVAETGTVNIFPQADPDEIIGVEVYGFE